MSVPIAPLKPGEYTPLPDAGIGALSTGKGNLPLESVEVTARVTGLTSGVEMSQGFRNPHDVPLEATYVFPLPDRAAVTAFRMEADDRVIEGTLKERGEARRDYDEAMAQGKRAAIAEEDRPDVFTIRVGNIVPGERVTVRLTLSQPLPYEDGAATFRFPLVVAPRYIPGTPLDGDASGSGVAPDTDAVPDASRITPPVLLPGFPNPVRLSLAVHVDPAGLDLRELRSSLHTVTEENGTVRLSPGERLDRDFLLRLQFAASASLELFPDTPGDRTASPLSGTAPGEGEAGVHAAEDGDGTFALTVLPPDLDEEARRRPRDVALLLDRSGSMTGWKIIAARRAAARIVDTLTSEDRFAVLSFDSVVERPQDLGAGLSPATDRNRYRAVEHLSRLEARGGTEMLDPMEQGLALLDDPGRDRVLVLVTDGQVGNEDQILERLTTRLAAVRVHTVGIDRAVNAGFLGRLAGLGSGRCELVESEDRLDEAMEHIHRRIGSPLVTALTLKPDGLNVLPSTVTHLSSLYPGVPLRVWGRYQGPAHGTATIHGQTPTGHPWDHHLTAVLPTSSPASSPDGGVTADTRAVAGTTTDGGQAGLGGVVDGAVRAVWARAHLRRLEDRYAAGEYELEQEIVRTSLRHGVLCRFTAFVAVDTRVVTTPGGATHRVIQPVEMPSGWEMPLATAPMMAAAPVAYTTAAAPSFFGTGQKYPAAGQEMVQGTLGAAPAPPPGAAPAPPTGPGPGPASAPPTGPVPGPAPRGRFGIAKRMPRPAPGLVRHSPETIRPQLTEELSRLRANQDLSPADRMSYLADLASRLSALATYLGDDGPLATLAHDLEACETPSPDIDVEALWHRALTVLATLTSDLSTPPPTTDPPAPRRPFWKRP
ncbi:VIT domain-containing protein [Sphaerisporangium sp. B11E5]|uniref:VIT domain-containing protein n=1 Tax=Sphaerisporangium sp. B11E5 TaxID=3153563 RepID=UPI00325DDB35